MPELRPNPFADLYFCVTAQHRPELILLALAAAVLGGGTGTLALRRARVAQGRTRIAWAAAAGLALGGGGWAAHYIALLGYLAGAPLGFFLGATLGSLALITLAGVIAAVLLLRLPTIGGVAVAGLCFGGGLAAMHYTGMAALRIPVVLRWDADFVAASVAVSIILSFPALALGRFGYGKVTGAAAVACFGLLVFFMHMTGMTALHLVPGRSAASGLVISPAVLAAWIGAVTMALFAVGLAIVIANRRAQARVEETSRQLDTAMENMHEGLCLFNAQERLVLCNRRFREMWRLTVDACVPGAGLEALVAAGFLNCDGLEAGAGCLGDIREVLRDLRAGRPAAPLIADLDDGRIIAIASNALPDGGWVTTCTDVTDLRRSEAKLAHMALHDPLTGLPNRARHCRRLDHEIEQATQGGDKLAVIAIDLDRFKDINDVHGHAAGDLLLRMAGERLAASERKGETIARWGGDEFAATKRFTRDAELKEFILRLQECIGAPVEYGGQSLSIEASMGIALLPQDGWDSEALLNNASLALHRAKATISRRLCFFDPDTDEQARERRQLAGDLRQAIAQDQMELLYQPQFSLSNGTLCGYEALLRWDHPRRGVVSPAEFIPLAEESGAILAIGEWVLREACAEARWWPAEQTVAVNLSPVQFLQDGLVARVQAILVETGLSPRRLELEITETAIITDKARALHCLRQFKAMGISVAIDDFGTGYSSLDTLHSFPFDKIKIDKSFLMRADTSPQALAIIRTILALGKSLAIPVLAEGVEAEAQRAILKREGCDAAQGFLFGRPAVAPSLAQRRAAGF